MIRKASFLDIPAIINLGYRYVEEEVKGVCHHTGVWDANLSAHHLCQSLTDPTSFLYVAVRDNTVVGFLWGACHEMAPWNALPVASDYLFYLVPECRGSFAAIGLISKYKGWADSLGCVEARLSLASGINMERVGKAYERLGFKPFGSVYCNKLKEK